MLNPNDPSDYLDLQETGDFPAPETSEEMLRESDLDFGLAAGVEGVIVGDISRSSESSGTLVAEKYQLVEKIGEGGMGSVWFALQIAPVKRDVAIKLIKPGMDTLAVIARFEAERQALALMDHPNIARVLDGGMTDQGRPYFVMELVKGIPITKYCDERRLNLRQRLELFIPVCLAIQHAHQKGLIHRDVKPTNVLIALFDEKPVPKVIDFGLAKAIGKNQANAAHFTNYGAVLGTLEYMSPEQTTFSNRDIDTRSDVYSLGIVLYELLSGITPFPIAEQPDLGMEERLRIIREVEARRPSQKLTTVESKTIIATNRAMQLPALLKELSGDLDWIVMKAISKQRANRYPTANALARDVERYLKFEAIEARPPSKTYQLKRFLSRNRGLVLSVALMLILFSAGTAISIWQAYRATQASQFAEMNEARANQAQAESDRQRDLAIAARIRTRQALDSMTSSLAENFLARQNTITNDQREFLANVLSYYSEMIADPRDDEVSIALSANAARRVGWIQDRLGNRQASMDAYEIAVDRFSKLHEISPDNETYPDELSSTLNSYAYVLSNFGKRQQAEAVYGRGIDLQKAKLKRKPGDAHSWLQLGMLQHNLGLQFRDQGRQEDCRQQLQQAVETFRKIESDYPDFAGNPYQLAMAEASLGLIRGDQGAWSEGKQLLKSCRNRLERLLIEDKDNRDWSSGLAWCLNNFGIQLIANGEMADANECFIASIKILEKLAGQFPSASDYRMQLAIAEHQYASLLKSESRLKEAQIQIKKSVEQISHLIESNPESVDFIWEYGEAMKVQAEIFIAAENLQAAIDATDDGMDSWIGLTRSLGDSGKLYEPRLVQMRNTAAFASGLNQARESMYWEVATRLAEQQFSADKNPEAHRATTALMICRQAEGFLARDAVDEATTCLNSIEFDLMEANRDTSSLPFYELACAHARIVGKIPASNLGRDALIEKTLSLLRKASEKGQVEFNAASLNPDFESIQKLPEFQEWLKALRPK